MEKIFEGAISCKALLEAGSRDCKKLYIDKKKNTKDTRYLAKIAKSRGCEVVFCLRDEINALAIHIIWEVFQELSMHLGVMR